MDGLIKLTKTAHTAHNTKYQVVENRDDILVILAYVGSNGIEVRFPVLLVEWEKDFEYVQVRLREILKSSIHNV